MMILTACTPTARPTNNLYGGLQCKDQVSRGGGYLHWSHTEQEKKGGVGTLVDFSERHCLKIMNAIFKKNANRRWTWISPNGETKNEINFILTVKPQTITDITVLNSFHTGSDHHLVHASLTINTKLESLTSRRKTSNHQVLSTKLVQFKPNGFKARGVLSGSDIHTNNRQITAIIIKKHRQITAIIIKNTDKLQPSSS